MLRTVNVKPVPWMSSIVGAPATRDSSSSRGLKSDSSSAWKTLSTSARTVPTAADSVIVWRMTFPVATSSPSPLVLLSMGRLPRRTKEQIDIANSYVEFTAR